MSAESSGQLLHTMIRVFDLEKSIAFYTDKLGMKLLRRKDYPSGEFTLASGVLDFKWASSSRGQSLYFSR